ncbi:L-threonylcarbamoyladenylate synthase [Parendozoicomonas haliclonae]|uniref:Threonylcarbamoyl-AMP synthase n=1 Tax=Parendozoicomonas haliclonae TaxID=1960125 RepID=A0A1X7AJF3_9GAMM|nr:L-threonylcarbamoyladenylate synthase [Parendozoicomonas haliclonae]SMA46401.1 Threonylcarbamoyl-AMP synthase [Parendozoicomonas haliclonae]
MSEQAKQLQAQQSITAATDAVRTGGVIAYPTEAVWGLGCDPWNQRAVEQILAIKRRPVEKGLILVAASEEQLLPLLAPLTDEQRAVLTEHWPGPFTFLIPDHNLWAPEWVRGEHSSVAVRVSDHPMVKALCEQWGKPLVSTSANRAGEDALRSYEEVVSLLGEEVDVVVEGEVGQNASPSQICDLVSGNVIRS